MPTILLILTLSCLPVTTARAKGYSDQQIEQWARAHDVPEKVILWAKRHC